MARIRKVELKPEQVKEMEEFKKSHPELGIETLTDLTRRAIGFYIRGKRKEDKVLTSENRNSLE